MFIHAFLFAALSASRLVAADQMNGTAGTNFTINVGSIPLNTKVSWCQGQDNSCGQLCGTQSTLENNCDVNSLKFTCTCQNNSAPGLQYYIQTMPTFICEQAFNDCIQTNVGNAVGQTACTNDIKKNCGTLDPSKAYSNNNNNNNNNNSPSSGPSSSASPSASEPSPNSSTEHPASSSSAAGATLRTSNTGNSIALVAVGLFAAFL